MLLQLWGAKSFFFFFHFFFIFYCFVFLFFFFLYLQQQFDCSIWSVLMWKKLKILFFFFFDKQTPIGYADGMTMMNIRNFKYTLDTSTCSLDDDHRTRRIIFHGKTYWMVWFSNQNQQKKIKKSQGWPWKHKRLLLQQLFHVPCHPSFASAVFCMYPTRSWPLHPFNLNKYFSNIINRTYKKNKKDEKMLQLINYA